MTLIELFKWLKGRPFHIGFEDEPVSVEVIEDLKKQLTAEARLAHFTPSQTPVSSALPSPFLSHLEALIKETTLHSLYPIALLWLLSLPANGPQGTASIKLTRLLDKCSKECIDSIKATYPVLCEGHPRLMDFLAKQKEADSRLLQEGIMSQVVSAVKARRDFLKEALKEEKHPLGLISLFETHFGEFTDTMALLLWLLAEGVCVNDILSSGLLQKYFLYYSYDVKTIADLYSTLARFDEALPLVKEAECQACQTSTFPQHTLTGEFKKDASDVKRVTITPPDFAFTMTATNIASLYSVFGAAFLMKAIGLLLEKPNESLERVLRQFLNTKLSEAALLELVKGLALKPSLATLANLMEDETLKRLSVLQKGELLHLAPYKPFLIQDITSENLASYLKNQAFAESLLEQTAELMSLLVALEKSNRKVAEQLYEFLLDRLLEAPTQTLSNDLDNMFWALQPRDYVQRITASVLDELSKEFEAHIGSIDKTQFTQTSFYTLEDIWKVYAGKVSVLKEINPAISSNIPHDIYDLRRQILQHLFTTEVEKNPSLLRTQVQSMLTPRRVGEISLEEYERSLIEILVGVHSLPLQAAIRALLEADFPGIAWRTKSYGTCSIFLKAIHKRNSSFLTEYMTENIRVPSAEIVEAIVLSANLAELQPALLNYLAKAMTQEQQRQVMWGKVASKAQVKTVIYLCEEMENLKPSVGDILEALLSAANFGKLETVRYLCDRTQDPKPSQEGIDWALAGAAEKGQLSIVRYLCERTQDPKPSQEGMDRVLADAVKRGQVDFVRYLCERTQEPTPSRKVIHLALLWAVYSGKLESIHYLCERIKDLKPSQSVMETVLAEAAGHEQVGIVRYLCERTVDPKPSQEGIDWALREAAEKGLLSIVHYLCERAEDPKPSQKGIGWALEEAAEEGQLSIIRYLCDRAQDPKPTQEGIDRILKWAIQNGKLESIYYLCERTKDPKPSQEAIDGALREVAEKGQVSIVRYLCEELKNLKPSEGGIDLTLKWVAFDGQLASVRYLCERTEDPKPSQEGIDEALKWATQRGQLDAIKCLRTHLAKKHFSLESLQKSLSYAKASFKKDSDLYSFIENELSATQYNHRFFQHSETLPAKGGHEAIKFQRAKKLLCHYTRDTRDNTVCSFIITKLFYFDWWHHHTQAVRAILRKIDEGTITSYADLKPELNKITLENKTGSLARHIHYMDYHLFPDCNVPR